MPITIDDLFASVDANKITRETQDKLDYTNNTFDFGTDTTELNGTYFIPEGDPRLTDKVNYNFKKLANVSKPNYKQTDIDISANDNDMIITDTTNTINQSDDIDINVTDNSIYNVTIDNIDCLYTSIANKQKDTISFTAANNIIYDLTLNSSTVSFTSKNAIPHIINVDITLANSTLYDISVDGVSAQFTSSASATVAEVTNGLKSSIDALALNITVVDSGTNLTITGNTSGVYITLIANTSNLVYTTTQEPNATVDEIITALTPLLNGLNQLVTISATNQIIIESNTGGVSFTLSATSPNISITNDVATSNSTLFEIQTGLINTINSKSFNITATSTLTGIKIIADVSGIPYTQSISSNLSIVSSISNKSGEVIITLNSSLNAKIEILDIKNNFATNKAILRSTDLIMNSSNDFDLTINNNHYTALFVDNNWRIF